MHTSLPPPDLTAAYQAIFERLKTIEGIKAVYGANNLSDIMTGMSHTGIDHCLYLCYMGEKPVSQHAGQGKHQQYSVLYDVILAIQDYQRQGIPTGVGILKARIIQSLIGWNPFPEQRNPLYNLKAANAGESLYGTNFSLHPLRFEHNIIITGA